VNDEDDPLFQKALDDGIALFNEQKFFEAYEAWEKRWSEEESEGADLLQGLLQVAVAFAKLSDGNPRGTVKLLETASNKLSMYLPAAYGLDVEEFLGIVKQWQQRAQQMIDGAKQGASNYPRLGDK